jgi:Domain of unknown function (DUF5666)
MRKLILFCAAAGFLTAQPLLFIYGRLTAVSGDQIEVRDGRETHLLYSDPATQVWRGKDFHNFSALQIGDHVSVKYRTDAASRNVVVELVANRDKVEGPITRVGPGGFQVDENAGADPHSGYRRGLRDIVFDSGTRWEESLPEDLKVGRDVFVMGLKLPSGLLQATRVTVYQRNRPVRMKPGTRVIAPNGTVRTFMPDGTLR